jgi:phage-related holin
MFCILKDGIDISSYIFGNPDSPDKPLFILTLLEFGFALIQAYIFTVLSCIYLRDIFEGH